jgi:hypothetical protein
MLGTGLEDCSHLREFALTQNIDDWGNRDGGGCLKTSGCADRIADVLTRTKTKARTNAYPYVHALLSKNSLGDFISNSVFPHSCRTFRTPDRKHDVLEHSSPISFRVQLDMDV